MLSEKKTDFGFLPIKFQPTSPSSVIHIGLVLCLLTDASLLAKTSGVNQSFVCRVRSGDIVFVQSQKNSSKKKKSDKH